MARIAVVTIGRSNSPSAVSGLDSRSSRACRSNVSRSSAAETSSWEWVAIVSTREAAVLRCVWGNCSRSKGRNPACRGSGDVESAQPPRFPVPQRTASSPDPSHRRVVVIPDRDKGPAGTENSVNLGQCLLQVEPVQCLPGENGVHRVFGYRDSLGSAVQCGHRRERDRQLRAHLAVRFDRSYPSSGLHEACRQFSGSGSQIQYVLRVRRVGERNLGQSPLFYGGRIIRTVSGIGSRLCAGGTSPCRTVRTILGLICCAVAHHLNVVQRSRGHPDW
jgi:hypothetical protein